MVRTVKKAEERKDEIIKAACRLFLVKGYDSTTMKDVMVQLKIAKGTIYHYFTSKEDLLDAVLDFIVEDVVRHMQEAMDHAQGTALEKLKQLILSRANENHDQEIIDNLHQPSNTGMHIRLLARMITAEAPVFAELIRQGCNEGVFATSTPLECAEFILAAIQFLTDPGIYPWTQEQLIRRAVALPGLIEAQVKAPEGSFLFLLDIFRKAI